MKHVFINRKKILVLDYTVYYHYFGEKNNNEPK